MKLLTWNILRGGSKKRFNNIIKTLISHNADLIVLTEYWEGKGGVIRKALNEEGWIYQLESDAPAKTNGILIASKEPVKEVEYNYELPEATHRWVEIRVKNLNVLAIHIPVAGAKNWDKESFWKKVMKYADEMKDTNTVIIGDYNTGLKVDAEGAPFMCMEYMERLIELGWTDAWRTVHGAKNEFTWYSSTRSGTHNGFRIDHAFLTNSVKEKLVDAYYSHVEREVKYSDHSALIVEIDIK